MSGRKKSFFDLKSNMKYELYISVERETIFKVFSCSKNSKLLTILYNFHTFLINNEENICLNLNLNKYNHNKEHFLTAFHGLANMDSLKIYNKWSDKLAKTTYKSFKIKEIFVKCNDEYLTESQLINVIDSFSLINYLNSLSITFYISSDVITVKLTESLKELFKILQSLDKFSISIIYSPFLIQGDHWKFIIASLDSLSFSKLLNLNLCNLTLDCNDMVYIGKIMERLVNLISLRLELQNNNIYHKGIQSITNALISMEKLNELVLKLSQNFIGIYGGKLLSNYLEKTKFIYLHLEMNCCDIDDLGGIMLSESIGKIITLRKLVIMLVRNKLCDNFGRSIACSLKKLTNIEELFLNIEGNYFSSVMKEELLNTYGELIKV